ncbi:hypothetical protein SNE40_001648 [Patella caerulea]|uniref:Endonuclease/exonuclease/phosphatase domain-containing protein n=1 Tax=Patella caerulea TaxID=87958 RepID=A0AAN8KCZ2_PATCE
MRICDSRKSSGGVLVLVKDALSIYTKRILVRDDFEEMVWLHINTKKLGLSRNLILGCVYVPPVNSIFYDDKDINCNITTIESALFSIKQIYEDTDVIIMGDINARTGTGVDFVENDNGAHIPSLEACYDTMRINHIPTEMIPTRHNCDMKINNFGKQLLDLCCENNVIILNGRITPDTRGNFTYVSSGCASTIDYVIVSPNLFPNVSTFSILETDLSKHFPVFCELKLCPNVKPITTNSSSHIVKYKWKPSFVDQFISNINSAEFIHNLDDVLEKLDTDMETSVKHLNEALLSVGDKSRMRISKQSDHRKQPHGLIPALLASRKQNLID